MLLFDVAPCLIGLAKSRYLGLARLREGSLFLSTINRLLGRFGYLVVKRDFFPVHSDLFHNGDTIFTRSFAKVPGKSLTSPERMFGLFSAIEYLVASSINGDIVECGVWKGGSSMLAALTLMELGASDRALHLFDTFEGMPTADANDVDFGGRSGAAFYNSDISADDRLVVSISEVEANMRSTGYPMERVRLIKGPVEQTLPSNAPDRIALLRLDTDFYSSTRHELEHLWPRVVPGGVVIIDDYGHWKGARQAVDEFLAHQRPLLLHRLDYTGRLFVKPIQ